MWWRKKPRELPEWAAQALANHNASCVALAAFEDKELRTQEDWDAYLRAKMAWQKTAERFHPGHVAYGKLFDAA